MRWAYTQPVVEKDNRQSNFDLTTGQQILPQDGSRESRALYKSYKKGFEPRLGFAWRPGERWVDARRLRHLSIHGRERAPTCGCRSTRRTSSSRPCSTTRRPAPARSATGFADVRPLDQPSGQVRAWDPNLRPQFTQQWNVFAEYLLTPSTSVNVGYVGTTPKHLVTPVEGNQPLPGVGDPSTWAPPQTRRPLYATAPLITNISTTAARGRSDYNGLQVEPPAAQRQAASSTWRRTR